MKNALAAAAIGLSGLAAIPAQAMQIAPLSTSAPYVTLVAGGCGIGFHRGPYGGCRPNGYGYGVVGVPGYGYGYHGGYGYMVIAAAIAMVEVIATVGPIAMGAVAAAITMALTSAIITITITDATKPLMPALACHRRLKSDYAASVRCG